MPKRPAEKEIGEDKSAETEPKHIILELKKLDVLDKVAYNLEEYLVNELLADKEHLDEADGFRSKIKDIIEQIFEELKESLGSNKRDSLSRHSLKYSTFF